TSYIEKASLSAASASSPFDRSTTTLTHTSLVLIMAMLMPRPARAPNILRATPVCVRMPTPKTNSTAIWSSAVTRAAGSMLPPPPAPAEAGSGHLEGHLRPPRLGQVLDDHVDDDAALRPRLEHPRTVAGLVGQAGDRDPAVVGVQVHAADQDVFHAGEAGGQL